MAKYHINSRGVPAICRAKNHCPLGSAFGSKSEASEAAQKEALEFKRDDLARSNESKKYIEGLAKERKFDWIESNSKKMDSTALESVVEEIEAVRKGNPKEKLEKIREQINDANKKQAEIIANEKEKLQTDSKELEEINEAKEKIKNIEAIIEKQDALIKESNEGACPKCGEGSLVKKKGAYGEFIACSNFPKCKHTQKPVEANPIQKQSLKYWQDNLETRERRLENKAKENAKANPEYSKLEEKKNELSNDRKLVEYVSSHSEKTPIEKIYEDKKAQEENIFNKIGHNKKTFGQSGISFGTNEITDKLTVDSKGNINNLYVEVPGEPGVPKRVIKIHESSNGNVELEDGTKLSFNTPFNFKKQRGTPDNPPPYNFYTTNSRSKKEYNGYRKIIANTVDSGD